MALALNKTTLKQQRDQLKMFKRFLPSLDLKRQQLLAALKQARIELADVQRRIVELGGRLEQLYPLLGSSTAATRNLASLVRIRDVPLDEENVLGTRLPIIRGHVEFDVADYSRLVTPFWVDFLIADLEKLAELRVHLQVRQERVERLDYAARRITQRVNLFEKVLIPRTQESIRRIVIFLSDQERAAVVRSKIAKNKHAE
ncbi:MAG: V-type ATP synthase subunit D [Planctomycetes bacterium]|nr:V-type ATP synthase subunit D [Planctomycetota bacterium]